MLLFFVLIGFLKAIFLQMDYVFPKFGIRELGANAPVGKAFGDQRYCDHFPCADRGRTETKVCSLSNGSDWRNYLHRGVFIMALPTEWFVSAANGVFGRWLGHAYLKVSGSIQPYYVMCALYLIVFWIGEAFYSPRVYEYAAANAPPGQEASYGSEGLSRSSLENSLSAPVAGCWLLLFPNTVRDTRNNVADFRVSSVYCTNRVNSLCNYIRVPEAGRQE